MPAHDFQPVDALLGPRKEPWTCNDSAVFNFESVPFGWFALQTQESILFAPVDIFLDRANCVKTDYLSFV